MIKQSTLTVHEAVLAKSFLSSYLMEFDSRVANRGLRDAIQFSKGTRLCYSRFLSGTPLRIHPHTNEQMESGIPSCIPRWLFSSHHTVRVGFTILTVSRGFRLDVNIDTEPITRSSLSRPNDISDDDLDYACMVLGIKASYVEWITFHMSAKRGPNGQAIMSAVHDYTLLPSWLKTKIISLAGIGLSQCMTLMDTISAGKHLIIDIWNKSFPRKSKLLRKLSAIKDKEGKTRVIAIFDYWSQSALKPLHDCLMGILRRLPTDCTFNQSSFMKRVPSNGVTYYSFDLSNATDRMPAEFQRRILSRIIGSERSYDWLDIMVKEGFSCPGQTELIKYSVGQPMGAYSS